MINLIPPTARKAIVREYWVRVAAVTLLVLGLVTTLFAIFLVPSYVFVMLQLRAVADTYAEAAVGSATYDASAATIRESNTYVAQLESGFAPAPLTEYIEIIDTLVGSAVTLEEIQVRQDRDGVVEPISIVGVAETRADLASFRDRLEQHELFAEAILPFSNLAKDVNVDFSITVTIMGTSTPQS